MSSFRKICFTLVTALFASGCATINLPEGGVKDTVPPVLVSSSPDSMELNFLSRELVFQFDEYFTVSNFQKQFLIVPPFEKQVSYTVKGKQLIVKLTEYPKLNTTYQIYFGECIKDLNEGNVLKNFYRVFSTGPSIDSASISGEIKFNGTDPGKDANLKLLLYTDISDSNLIHIRPEYVGYPQANGHFNIQYLKTGMYQLVVLNDLNNNYLLDKGELLGILHNTIHTDSTPGELLLFNNDDRDSSFVVRKINQLSALEFNAVFSPTLHHPTIEYCFPPDSTFQKSLYSSQNATGDSIRFFLNPSAINPADSILFRFTVEDSIINRTLQLNKKLDTHEIRFKTPQTFAAPNKPILLNCSFPLPTRYLVNTKLLNEKDSSYQMPDSISVSGMNYYLHFVPSLSEQGRFKLIPVLHDTDSMPSVLHFKPDTLQVLTSGLVNTGQIQFGIRNTTTNRLVVQLLKNNLVHFEEIVQNDTILQATYLDPGTYKLRAIIDVNRDGKFTTGSLRFKRNPERIYLLSEQIEVKSDWIIKDLQFTVGESN